MQKKILLKKKTQNLESKEEEKKNKHKHIHLSGVIAN